MPDELDATSDRMVQEEKILMDKHRLMMSSQDVSEDCIECGEFIHKARQEATGGTDMCVSCQSIEETKQKGYR